MRLKLRTMSWLATLALLGGCSTAPFCDLLDYVAPHNRLDPKHLKQGGGVCVPGQGRGGAPPGLPMVPAPTPMVPPAPVPIVPPPSASPFDQTQTPPIAVPPPPPPVPPSMK